MYYFFYTYLDLICVALFAFGICVVLFGLSYCISDNNIYIDKASGYECGFDPFSDARDPFNIKFYLISILFIIFDVEMIFFFPWILCQPYIIDYGYGFFSMYIFFFILVLGFFYEYRKKALDWGE